MNRKAEKKYFQQKIWQMNAPYYYDVFIDFYTPHPTMSFDWTRQKTINNNCIEQEFVFGTPNGTGIGVGKVILPKEECLIRQTDYSNGMIGYYEIESSLSKMKLEKMIQFGGDCNRIRFIPSTSFIIIQQSFLLTNSEKAFIQLIDIENNSISIVGNQETDGYGISINMFERNKIVTCSNKGNCYFWDLNELKQIKNIKIENEISVNDIDWNYLNSQVICVTESNQIVFIDDKSLNKTYYNGGSVMNTCCFSPLTPNLLATGHEKGLVKLWDQRNMSSPLFVIHQHKSSHKSNSVNSLQFSPHQPTLLLSTSSDKTVNIYNLANIGKPTELSFSHCAHNSQVVEARWNPNCYGFIASVAEEYDIHIWKNTENTTN
ncbi:histone acetyltransferase type B subunit [Entamoeba histolytica HM-3:IMSS]|uniref:Histone acetyltransferase type B subunit n=1 Tax=Entamoeba histolytica HM-3:IMSS TaxID=885315 RepID=M7W9F4_ENTHI|nr:histone acetyltransferase type B subunit [Entamoeba histolytica HM-3:IMSS]